MLVAIVAVVSLVTAAVEIHIRSPVYIRPHGEVTKRLGILFRITPALAALTTVNMSASCLLGLEQTIKAFLPIIFVPLWRLSALSLVIVLVVVILVTLVPILVVVSVLRIAALMIIIIVAPVAI